MRDEIVERMNGYAEAWRSLDADRLLEFYEDDPSFRVYNDGQVLTRSELAAAVTGLCSSLRRFDATWEGLEVIPLGEDVALAASRFTRVLVDGSGHGTRDWGTVTWVWRRTGEGWKIIHGHGAHYPGELPSDAADRADSGPGEGDVVTTSTGPDRYELVATARLDCDPAELWALLCDWERLVAVGLPGMTSDFRWLSGGPGEAPSTFEFAVGDAVLREEIYELTAEEESDRYRLRYRALEPALGVLEYDAVLAVEPADGGATAFRARRSVRLEEGTSPAMLARMIEGEMQCLRDHFAAQR